MSKLNSELHHLLAHWAADCVEHVLPVFEELYPDDDRPGVAMEAARAWADGELKMRDARKFAFAAHASARDLEAGDAAEDPDNKKAIAVARAAGHAAATAHVPSHAKYAAAYALKAADDEEEERAWQMEQLPENCKFILE